MVKSINYYCPFSSDSWVAGAIVGAVFGFIVLITIIYICCQAGNCCCKSPKLYHRHRAINPVCKYISQSAINVCINYVLFFSLLMTAAIVCWSVCRIAWSEYLKISSIDTLVYPIKRSITKSKYGDLQKYSPINVYILRIVIKPWQMYRKQIPTESRIRSLYPLCATLGFAPGLL